MHNASIRTKQLLDFIPVNGNWNVGYMNLVGTISGKEKYRKLETEKIKFKKKSNENIFCIHG